MYSKFVGYSPPLLILNSPPIKNAGLTLACQVGDTFSSNSQAEKSVTNGAKDAKVRVFTLAKRDVKATRGKQNHRPFS
jgi:hypothetical protein